MINTCLFGDCRELLRSMPDEYVQMCVTSPPYFCLRDYGVDGQLGLESTPEEYVTSMVEVFREVKRVLRSDGTLWLNIGDSYASAGGAHGGRADNQKGVGAKRAHESGNGDQIARRAPIGLKPKDLIGIPWMLAFALRADGWYLRQDIIWAKPNPMPESVTDRCTKSHEYLFLLSKSERYFFDYEAIKEPIAAASAARYAQNIDAQTGSDRVPGKTNGPHWAIGGPRAKGNRKTFRGGGVYTGNQSFNNHASAENDSVGNAPNESGLRNRRSVWNIATRPYKGAHFATFPPALIEPCILAGSRPSDIVLDPFMGSGTTAQVATQYGRNWIGCELNPAYEKLQEDRLRQSGLAL